MADAPQVHCSAVRVVHSMFLFGLITEKFCSVCTQRDSLINYLSLLAQGVLFQNPFPICRAGSTETSPKILMVEECSHVELCCRLKWHTLDSASIWTTSEAWIKKKKVSQEGVKTKNPKNKCAAIIENFLQGGTLQEKINCNFSTRQREIIGGPHTGWFLREPAGAAPHTAQMKPVFSSVILMMRWCLKSTSNQITQQASLKKLQSCPEHSYITTPL